MKEFLIKLATTGVKEKDLLKKDRELIRELLLLKAVKKKKDTYKLESKFRAGVIDVAQNGTGYLEVLGGKKAKKDLLIEKYDLNGASKGDLVIAKRIYTKKSTRPKAKVIYIVEKKFLTTIVYTDEKNGRIVGINIKNDMVIDITASQKSLKQLPLNTVLKLDSSTNAIMDVLGVLDDPKVDEKISLALYNKKEEFSKEAEAEAKSHGDFVDKSMYPNRVDLTHLPFCTIDPPTAKDFDDAIYFDKEEFALYVAIADVSEYVFEMGPIDKEAKERGFSIYFPHKSIPMLPRALSENICSLKPNEDRLTFTFKITLDRETLEPLKEELIESVIHSRRRFTYDEIDLYLQDPKKASKEDQKILSYILPLYEVTKKLRAKRLQKGFDFANSEIRMELDENQNLIKTTIEKETPSHALIEDCMLLANKAAAKYFKRGIFRTHEKPDLDKIRELLDDLAIIGIFANFTQDIHQLIIEIQQKAKEMDLEEHVGKLLIKTQKQAKYTFDNIGHFGLGFDKYTHFTSPIRRYSDLILHRLLKAIIKGDEKKEQFILDNMEPLTVKISELERECAKVEWDFMDRKYARWAKSKEGEIFEGIIVDPEKNPIAIIEDENIKGCRVFLLDQDAELFERVKVKIVNSNIAEAKIFAKIVEKMDV
ncbi:MAG: VacB/RNase II family 3'-5' exoribonuclease [Epsilonproteobacteria bacterium]|nr:VacB/RNase II family 3'-5' exoribonuclease [Campylobacterota bacterium]